MIREDNINVVVFKIVEKLQNSSLFLEMKADLQVKLHRLYEKIDHYSLDVRQYLSQKKKFKAISLYNYH